MGGLTVIPSAAAIVPAYPMNSAGKTIDTAECDAFPEFATGNPPAMAILFFVLQIAADKALATARVSLFSLHSASNRYYTAIVYSSSMNNAGNWGGLTVIPVITVILSAAAIVPAYPMNSAGKTIDTAECDAFPEFVTGNPPANTKTLWIL